jgi:hypothetical protein
MFAAAEKTVVVPASAVITRSKTHAAAQERVWVALATADAHSEALADGLDLLA